MFISTGGCRRGEPHLFCRLTIILQRSIYGVTNISIKSESISFTSKPRLDGIKTFKLWSRTAKCHIKAIDKEYYS